MPLSKQEEFFVPEFSEDAVSIATTERSSFSTRGHTASASSRVANMNDVEEPEESSETEVGATDSHSRTRRSERRAKRSEEEDVFVKPSEPAARATRSSARRSKKGSEDEDGGEVSASDSLSSEFEELGKEEVPLNRDETTSATGDG
jgi:hypothetical protein